MFVSDLDVELTLIYVIAENLLAWQLTPVASPHRRARRVSTGDQHQRECCLWQRCLVTNAGEALRLTDMWKITKYCCHQKQDRQLWTLPVSGVVHGSQIKRRDSHNLPSLSHEDTCTNNKELSSFATQFPRSRGKEAWFKSWKCPSRDVQSWEKVFAKLAKQYPGRARHKS